MLEKGRTDLGRSIYHEEDGRSVWYGLRGLQVVGGDEVPESVMTRFAAWVNERKDNYVGGRGHTRGTAIEVKGDDDDAEDKEQPKDKDKDKGEDKARTSQRRKARTKASARTRTRTRTRPKQPRHLSHRSLGPSSPSTPSKWLTFGLWLTRWHTGAKTP